MWKLINKFVDKNGKDKSKLLPLYTKGKKNLKKKFSNSNRKKKAGQVKIFTPEEIKEYEESLK